MNNQKLSTLINPSNGNLAFKIITFEEEPIFDHIQRLNYYTIILISNGSGKLKVDFTESNFEQNTLLSFVPYQPFMVSENNKLSGMIIHFHPDFFCIHKHQNEVACNGVLFNDIYKPPITKLIPQETAQLHEIIIQMQSEMQQVQLAQYELLISFLKIFLIIASRIKVNQSQLAQDNFKDIKEPFVLNNLKEAIEQNYKSKHAPSDYATLLNVTPKNLSKLTKAHFNKTLTNLISERIIIEAKRELYLTSKTIKEIAYELGYQDEYYFSRFFKTNADVSPQLFRETVGRAKAEA